MPDRIRVAVDGGKYVFIETDVGTVKILRNQEDWTDITIGAKALIALMYELHEQNERVEKLEADLRRSQDTVSRYRYPDTTGQ